MVVIKKVLRLLSVTILIFSLLLCSCNNSASGCKNHKDKDNNGVCDKCYQSVFVYFDFYALGDTVNKTSNQKLEDYLNHSNENKKNAVFLSTGDMWKSGDSASSEWMNEFGFSAMTPGVYDFKLDKNSFKSYANSVDFPLLAINIYNDKDRLADFCIPSVLIKNDGIKIGIIGAVGDYYSSISNEHDDIYFKTGEELNGLVKKEATRLRKKGADFIVYMLQMGNTYSESLYDTSLSDGYVDLVFEGNTNQSYNFKDAHGVYHLQNNEADTVGISHAEVSFNTVTDTPAVRIAELVSNEEYNKIEYIPKDPEVSQNPSSSNKGNSSDNTSIGTNSIGSDVSNPTQSSDGCKQHTDKDNNEICDVCSKSVIVYVDFYSINDLHGKLADADSHVGVDELSTYLKNARKTDEYAFFVSAGDMWQGSAESNMTKGLIMTDWMNELDFSALALGNHEYDWGEEYIESNEELAEFPFLAINVYDRATNKLVDYCESSTIVEAGGVQIGIIGAIGDCYSSIAVDKCEDVYFKVGKELTNLVKAESESLKKSGADFIVYLLHDGYGSTNLGSVQQVNSSNISSYYDTSLSNGYVDLVFEGHSHQGYRLQDEYGVYHLQNRGDNKGGISHAEIAINSVTYKSTVGTAELVSTSVYQNLDDDPVVENLLEKYDKQISSATKVLGTNCRYRNSTELQQLVAKLYYETGAKAWGNEYKIVLGGGFMSIRSPYNLPAGEVTYADLQSIFPFDNQLTLCSIKGSDLKSKFLRERDRYYVHCGEYGQSIKDSIVNNETYYIVVDSYSAYYAPNKLTVIKEYDPNVFARDLLAEYIKNGGLAE